MFLPPDSTFHLLPDNPLLVVFLGQCREDPGSAAAAPPGHELLWCPSASLLQRLWCLLSWNRGRTGQTLSGFKTCLQLKLCSQIAAEAAWGSSELGTWVLFMTELLCDLEQLPAPLSHSPASPAAEWDGNTYFICKGIVWCNFATNWM